MSLLEKAYKPILRRWRLFEFPDNYADLVIDNVIYTPDFDCTPDPKGIGHYYYTEMTNKKHKVAQIDGYTKEKDTFGALLKRSVRAALTMIDKGIKPGDHISLCSYLHLNTAVPLIASYFTGSIMGAIDSLMSVEDAAFLLNQTSPKIIFVDPCVVGLVEKVVERIGINTIIVVFGETTQHTPFSEFIRPHKNENKFKPREVENLDEIALLVFSSGSTGRPKGICYNHSCMMYFNALRTPFDTTKILYTVAVPYWNVFALYIHLTVKYDCLRLVYPKFDIDNVWELFYQHVDLAFLTPLQALQLARSKKPENVNLKNLGVLAIGGNPISPKQLIEIKSAFSHSLVIQSYSQSEVFEGILRFDSEPSVLKLMERSSNSVGTVMQGFSYKIVDINTDKILGPNQIGELRIKSKSEFLGYFNQDSADCYDSDGWLKTGDRFYYNEDLCFYFVDRIKESFKFLDCHHVCPIEIENVILTLDPIESAIVIGMPHETDYNHAMAIVKLKPNAKTISAEEIVKHVEEKLEDHKWLRGGVKFVDAFPITYNGKINRYKLKDMVLNKKI